MDVIDNGNHILNNNRLMLFIFVLCENEIVLPNKSFKYLSTKVVSTAQ